MSVSIEEINDAKELYGLSDSWYYDNILAKTIHYKFLGKLDEFILYDDLSDEYGNTIFQLRSRNYNDGYIELIRLKNKKTLIREYKFDDNRLISFIYNKTSVKVSNKLANSFIRFFDDRAKKLDIIRLKDYFVRHSYHGKIFDRLVTKLSKIYKK